MIPLFNHFSAEIRIHQNERERSAFIKTHITIFHVETIEPERYFWKIESISNHTEPKKKKVKEEVHAPGS